MASSVSPGACAHSFLPFPGLRGHEIAGVRWGVSGGACGHRAVPWLLLVQCCSSHKATCQLSCLRCYHKNPDRCQLLVPALSLYPTWLHFQGVSAVRGQPHYAPFLHDSAEASGFLPTPEPQGVVP